MAILGALMSITSLSTDIYLPAMPQMHVELQGDIELTITGFLIGFALGQIIWGPISDRYGRKLPLTIGMAMFVLGSIGCALSQTITEIMVWRIVQALGACTGPMLSRAMVRDLFGRTKAAEMLSTLMILMALAPILGPVLGGQMIKITSWHSIFWLLAIIGSLLLVSILLLPETLPPDKRKNASLGQAFKNYRILLSNRKFMRYTLCVTFYYVAVYAFIAGSPQAYISYFGISPEYYGWLFALNIVGFIGISFMNRRLVRRFSLDTLLRIATAIAMIAGTVLAVLVKFQIGGIYGIVIPFFFYLSMNGIIAACATAAALDDVPEMAGAASALLGSLQYGSGILSTVLLAVFATETPWAMAWIIGVFAMASALTVNLKTVSGAPVSDNP